MKATDKDVAAPSRKFWIYILGGLAVIISGLLIAILWRVFSPEMDRSADRAAKTVAPAPKITPAVKPAVQDQAPLTFISTYYQAIAAGKVNQVQSAWESPNSQPARYAAQAVREFAVNARCQPSQIERASVKDSSDTVLSVLLQCHGPQGGQAHPVTFHLKVDKSNAWKIASLQAPAGSFLSQTGGVTVANFIPDPTNTVYDFYAALHQQDCQTAVRLRPDYKSCDSLEKVSSIQVTPLQIDEDKAALRADVAFKRKGHSEESFNGYISLQRSKDGLWLIQNFASAEKVKPEEFITDFAMMKLKPLVEEAQEGSESFNNSLTQQTLPPENTSTDTVATLSAKPEPENVSITPQYDRLNPATGPLANVTPFRSSGSERILQALWGSEQLRGNSTDKDILSLKDRPDYSPPLRQTPRYRLQPLPNYLRGSIRAVKMPDPDKKLVALTFDLCERTSEIAGYDADVVNYLRAQQVPATFYAGGKWMRSHPDQTKQLMADPLFEIGNHAWTHGNMRVLTGQEMKEQVVWTQAQYELLRENLAEDLRQRGVAPEEINRIPPVPLTFRYPYGTCSQEALNFMADYGLRSIQWDIVTADPWRKQTADGIVKTVLGGIKPGSIIIAHANGRGWKTGEALPRLIPALRARGYRFVTVSQLLAEGKAVEAADTCYELRVGDNQAYDRKVGKGTE